MVAILLIPSPLLSSAGLHEPSQYHALSSRITMRVREALRRVIPGGGRRREFTVQVERARVIKALHAKGATLSQLARANLTFDAGQAFVVNDGQELRACRDAKSAIAAVVRAKRWCSAIDLAAIRTSSAE
jgi:hypothetical protein